MKREISLKAAIEKKAIDIVMLDLRELSNFTDYFLIMSGNSDRHTQALAQEIIKKMEESGYNPLGIEGFNKGHWILLDFGEVIIHIFFEPIRTYYDLEGLWIDAPRVNLEKIKRKIGG
jgi:ribosome-associated protein